MTTTNISADILDESKVPAEFSIKPVQVNDCTFGLATGLSHEATLWIPSWGKLTDGSLIAIPTNILHNIAAQTWTAISKTDLSESPLDEAEFKYLSLGDRLEEVVQKSIEKSFSSLDSRYLNDHVHKLQLDKLSVPYDSEYSLSSIKALQGGVIFGSFRPVSFNGQDIDPKDIVHADQPTKMESRVDGIESISNVWPFLFKGFQEVKLQFRPEVLLKSGVKRELNDERSSAFISHMQDYLDSVGEDSELFKQLRMGMKARNLSEDTKTLLRQVANSWLHKNQISVSDTRFGQDRDKAYFLDVSRYRPAAEVIEPTNLVLGK